MGQTILIVEDDKDLRENICSILQNEGFQTTEAQNGTQALDKLLPSVSEAEMLFSFTQFCNVYMR